MAGFCNSVAGLQTPNLPESQAEIAESLWPFIEIIPVFRRLRPETGFDLHWAAELAVFYATFSAVAHVKLGNAEWALPCRACSGRDFCDPRLSEPRPPPTIAA